MRKLSYNLLLDEKLHSLVASGNHEAFVELKNRYHRHAHAFGSELLNQYYNTGVSLKDLVAFCDGCFPNIVKKYVSGISSFYGFWKDNIQYVAMDYLYNNSYVGQASFFSGSLSFDQERDDRYCYDDVLAEKDINPTIERLIAEVKTLLIKYDKEFTHTEKTLINLALSGYTVKDFEETGLYKKSYLYLTFNSAVEKLKKFQKESHKNKK